MKGLTKRQRTALAFLRDHADRGVDAAELAGALDTSKQGAVMTAQSLVDRGLAVKFKGGVYPVRMHYQASEVMR